MNDNPYRQLPAVHDLLAHPSLKDFRDACAPNVILRAVRHELAAERELLKSGQPLSEAEGLIVRIVAHLEAEIRPHYRAVINASGVVLHTNLGRAPLAEEAAQAAYQAGRGYLNLEVDLETGKRASRQNPIREILSRLTG